jgi:hypothetical protein
MLWGRLWGRMKNEPGFRSETRWGAELDQYSPGRVMVRKIRGRILPCESCARIYKCAMYQFNTRHLLHGEYARGTNRIQWCDIYLPNKIPQDVRSKVMNQGMQN